MKSNKVLVAFISMLGVVLILSGCGPKTTQIKSSMYRTNIDAYLNQPKGDGPFPAVIVLHTVGGMKSHVTEFANNLSEEGYVTLAVDYFSGYRGRGKFLGYDQHIVDAYDYLKSLPNVDPKRIGMAGFSLGPRKALNFISAESEQRPVKALVSYYVGRLHLIGSPSTSDKYPPILFLHGELDQETDPEEVKSFCDEQNKINNNCEYHIYSGIKHSFDHSSKKYDGYDSGTTKDAYIRSVDFLNKHLSN